MSLRPFMVSEALFSQLLAAGPLAPALFPRRYGTVLPVIGTGSPVPPAASKAPAVLLTLDPSYPIRHWFCISRHDETMRALGSSALGAFASERSGEVGRPFRIEGYAIASADGMIADSTGVMPDALKFEADQRFFLGALERAAVVAHGRLSHEGDPDSHARLRLILTRRVSGLAPDPGNPNTWLWNPAGATLEEARAAVGCGDGAMAIAGGTEVFSLFLKIGYDVFYLARAKDVRLPGGVPVFSQGRFGQPPEDVLRAAGLKPAETARLDDDVSLVKWTA